MSVLAETWGVGQVFLSMLYFTLFFIWIYLLIAIFADVFRSHDLSGWGKAAWCIFIIVLPFLGVFVYLIARGNKMHEHVAQDYQAADLAQKEYIRQAVSESPASQLTQLNDLHDKGVIDDAEFQRLKAKIAV